MFGRLRSREDAAAHGIEWSYSLTVAHRHHVLSRLHTLSNIDKHRRLPLLAWFPDLVYWFSDEEEDGYQWRPQKMSPVKFVDGTLLGYLSNRSGSKLPRADLRHEMNLVIDDDPAGLHSSIDKEMNHWHAQVSNVILQVLRSAGD